MNSYFTGCVLMHFVVLSLLYCFYFQKCRQTSDSIEKIINANSSSGVDLNVSFMIFTHVIAQLECQVDLSTRQCHLPNQLAIQSCQLHTKDGLAALLLSSSGICHLRSGFK